MIGVVLAAGMASRLRPLTNDRPKCLLTVGSRTLLQRTFDALIAAGIKEFVVVTGYRGEMIRHFLDKQYADANLTFHFLHNADYQNNNNIFSLWMTRDIVRGKEFILLDSDILFDPKIITRMVQEPGTALALNRHELGDEEIKVIVDEQNRVVEISKVCSIADAVGESVGIEKMDADSKGSFRSSIASILWIQPISSPSNSIPLRISTAPGNLYRPNSSKANDRLQSSRGGERRIPCLGTDEKGVAGGNRLAGGLH